MGKDVVLWAGAGQIGMAIARRIGTGKKIVVGDKKLENAESTAKIMNEAGFDVVPVQMDLSDKTSILDFIKAGQAYGEVAMLINAAGVSPSQASVETILKVDLYGTAVLLEEVGKVIKEGGVGITISSQSGHRMPQLSAAEDEQLACTPVEKLLSLDSRPGTADEVANVAELLMGEKGAFITGTDFLCDGGATASYFYGPLKPAQS